MHEAGHFPLSCIRQNLASDFTHFHPASQHPHTTQSLAVPYDPAETIQTSWHALVAEPCQVEQLGLNFCVLPITPSSSPLLMMGEAYRDER